MRTQNSRLAPHRARQFKSQGKRWLAALASIVLLLLATPTSVALQTARMALPNGFEEHAERIAVSGFGGRNKGSYRFADYHGDFTRGESRLGVFDPLYVASKGKSSFTFRETADAGVLSASCQMTKGTVNIGIVTFDPKKMAYHCEFRRDGQLLGAQFVLGQPKPGTMTERALAMDIRRGEAAILSQSFTFESVHKYRSSRLQSPTPVGYLVHAADQVVAAVELTDWNPTFYFATGLSDAQRHAAMVVALALAVLRDPANSPLED